ncbi:MAG: hypothetical protein DWQ06_14795 [Calditrichaeota bacterium]|nr:MAG: hypothetical protein DWQ06_14795 [Calditrichota bacterium]
MLKENEIKIRLNKKAVINYKKASRNTKKQLEELISIWLEEVDFEERTKNFEGILDSVSTKAKERGLTDEILEEILNEK